jgi:undecaprenyl-diphosphatase
MGRRSDDSDLENLRLSWVIVVATALTGAMGILIDRLEPGSDPRLVSVLFIVTGFILISSRFFSGNRTYRQIGLRDAVVVGMAQGFGVFPGISRSGITISAGLAAGLERERAGEFAFLVSIPAIIGAFILTLRDASDLSRAVSVPALAAGFVSALVVGIFALVVLLRLVRSGRLYLFAIYLIPVGIAGLFLF